ncbi:cyclic nucleotide-gated ion channel 1-like [Humulus lupulus]|uniref:cyclic nucleotide-gated ion channel 1-like n=1 Tax=Humulus lupulus TaxID=3486 RepID=UPI002B417A8F|nr:cyclic nucleotide-gated ion channel 1-like [Humulus lupulus]XP_062119894.1 cyclic nucleotide-gated ion channel 1-like [Humulus lupulus]
MNNLEGKHLVTSRDDYSPKQDNSIATKDGRQDHSPHNKDKIKVEKILNPWAAYSRLWNKIFLASCVIGVSIDPLFLYIPIVNEEQKCIDRDFKMEIISLVLRSLTDLFYVLHIIFRLKTALAMSKEFGLSIFTGFPWSYLLIDVLAILPLPQMVVLVYFSKLSGSKSLVARKFINSLLILQYLPRILRVYLSAKELGSTFDSLTRRVSVRGAFFFFLYIIFGHVFGAFWYFYSIFHESRCWHLACKKLTPQECIPGPFDCHSRHPMKNFTKLNQYCPVNPPNTDIFDFGIFSQAIESRIVCKTDFTKKFFRSFWWGLRNLSSFGQNLDTTSNVQENVFAIVISILGLLLFLYLIGNLQFAAWASKILGMKKYDSNTTKQKAELWISKNEISEDVTPKIKKFIQLRLQEGKDVDNINLLHVLPFSLAMLIKKHMCFPILRKVPQFQNMDEFVHETICKYLKPVTYSEKSYIIRKGEPLDMMLFITQGVVWSFGSSTSPMNGLQKGDFFGNELVEWQLNSTSYNDFPISTANFKSHTNVEAFALMAIDLKHALSHCWPKFSKYYLTSDESMPEGLKYFAATSVQREFRCYMMNKKEQDKFTIRTVY